MTDEPTPAAVPAQGPGLRRGREPELDPIQPLAAARARLTPPKVKPKRKVDPNIALGMNAAGVTQAKIAKVFNTTHQAVENALATIPDHREQVLEIRAKLKLMKMQKSDRVESRMWDRLEQEVDKGDARDVDAISRALGAVEKIQASASGENNKMEVSGIPAPTPIDLKVLVQNLLEK